MSNEELFDAPPPTEEGGPPQPTTDIHTICSRIAILDTQKARYESELEAIAAQRKPLEERLLNAISSGADFRRTSVGGRTVYVRGESKPRPKNGDKPAMLAGLKAAGFAAYVREDCPYQSLRGLVNSFVAEYCQQHEIDQLGCDPNEALPPELAGVIEVAKEFKIVSIKA